MGSFWRIPRDEEKARCSHQLEATALHGCARYHLDEIGGEIGFCEAVVFKLDGERLEAIELKRLPKAP